MSATIAADNVVVALYFAFLFFLSTSGETGKFSSKMTNDEMVVEENFFSTGSEPSLSEEIILPNEKKQKPITTSSIAYSIATASCLVTFGGILTQAIFPSLSSRWHLPLSYLDGFNVSAAQELP